MMFGNPTNACNICGSPEFMPGPNARMAASGKPPCCRGCGALERQRILRRVFQCLPIGFLDWRRGLQFSRDPAINAKWFRTYEVSIYGGDNSLDMQRIDRPDGRYDFISLNHVLEFVAEDRKAFSELFRILADHGMLQACFSAPLGRDRTQDFEEPSGPHKAWHLYGQDLVQRFQCPERGLTVVQVQEEDPCTGVSEVIHFFLRDKSVAEPLLGCLSASPTARPAIVRP